MMMGKSSTESNTQIEEERNHLEDRPGNTTSATEVSECDNVRLGEYSPEISEGNQPILQEPLLLDTSHVAVSNVTELPGTDMKNKTFMVEPINGIDDPNSCLSSIGESTPFISEGSVTSPLESNSEDEASAKFEE